MSDNGHFRDLVARLQKMEATIGAAESITAGLFGFLLTREDGAGDVFRGSLVAYQTGVKRELLEVSAEAVVSAAAAEEMALAACRLLGADIGVGLTGVAGPETQEGMPVGTVFIAVAKNGGAQSKRFNFDGAPDEVRHRAAREAAALALLFA